MTDIDQDIQAEIDRLTEIEIQKMQRAEVARAGSNSGVNQRQQGEPQNANQQ